jgi:hypothetical protein
MRKNTKRRIREDRPTYTQIRPGEWHITIPAGYSGWLLPEDVISLAVLDRLAADPLGRERVTPNRGRTGVPQQSREERRRLRDQHRLVVLQRLATSQRHLDALCDNEGFDRITWTEQGQLSRSRKHRLAEQRDALNRKARQS